MNRLFYKNKGASQLKECPICHEKCFVDMEVCFGCLYRFTEEDNKKLLVNLVEDNCLKVERIEHDSSGRSEAVEQTAREDCNGTEDEIIEAGSESVETIETSTFVQGFEISVWIKPLGNSLE